MQTEENNLYLEDYRLAAMLQKEREIATLLRSDLFTTSVPWGWPASENILATLQSRTSAPGKPCPAFRREAPGRGPGFRAHRGGWVHGRLRTSLSQDRDCAS